MTLPEEEEALVKELDRRRGSHLRSRICRADESRIGLQREVLDYCERRLNCFAILDSNRRGTLRAACGDIKGVVEAMAGVAVEKWRSLLSLDSGTRWPGGDRWFRPALRSYSRDLCPGG